MPESPSSRSFMALLVPRRDPEDRHHLGLLRLGMDDVGARAAAEPAGALVDADEDPGMVIPVAVLHPDLLAFLEFGLLLPHRSSLVDSPTGSRVASHILRPS